jgi:glyoxylase-like metal-dependent hydrolase (beta-lactamase superfamily II)
MRTEAMIRIGVSVVLSVLLLWALVFGEVESRVESPRVVDLGSGVYAVLDLYHPSSAVGTNAGFIITEGAVVFIDAGMTQRSAEFIWETAHKMMKGDEDLYLTLTHHHSDHVFGMKVFKDKGVRVIAHVQTKAFLKEHGPEYKDNMLRMMGLTAEQGDSLFGDVVLSLPDTTMTEDSTLEIDGQTVQILFTPGHVAGELVVYHPGSRTLFAGDAIYEGVEPTTRFGGPNEWRTWLEQLARLKQFEIEVICPGHGGLCDKKEIDRNMEYLRTLLEDK